MKYLTTFMLFALLGYAGLSVAETAVVETTTLANPIAPVLDAISTITAAVAPTPTANKGDTAWMIMATV